MTFLTRHPAFTRVFIGGLASILLSIAAITFYHAASSPTDENLFTTSPSFVAAAHSVSALLTDARPRAGTGSTEGLRRGTPSQLDPGDLIISIGRRNTRTMAGFEQALGTLSGDSTSVRVYRPSKDAYLEFLVPVRAVIKGFGVPAPATVLVVDVTPGGASDRAGMKVGDMITRINGKEFESAMDADLILRRGTTGKASTYDILRNGEALSLHVTLAEFGFSLSLLVFCISGCVYIGTGTFVALKRPALPAALLLGFLFICLGFFISAVAIRHEPDVSLFTRVRDVMVVYGAYAGLAFAFHASLLFPWERPKVLNQKWVLRLLYGIALFSPLMLATPAPFVAWVLLAPYVFLGAVIMYIFREKLSPQQRRIQLPIKVAGLSVGIGSFLGAVLLTVFLGPGQFGFIGFLLVAVPLTYLFVIGRYRLLDMDLRIRRNVQYTLLSWVWGGIVALLLIRTFLALPGLSLPVFGISVTGFSVEIDPHPTSPDQLEFLRRLGVMVLAVIVWYLLWKVRAGGQRLIDRKYYRTQFDYRRAASELSEVLASRLTMNDIASGVVDALVGLLHLKRAGLLVFRDARTSCCDAATGVPDDAWRALVTRADAAFAGAIAPLTGASPVDALPSDMRQRVHSAGFWYVVPVRSKDQLVGSLMIGEKLSEAPHSADDLAFLNDVAKQISVSIDNAFLYEHLAEGERLRHELGIARRIQMSSLPAATPLIDGLDISGMSVPAMEVGGDFFDYLNGSDTDITIIVGDVSGKGTSAALYMSKVQGILRSLHGFGLGPRDLFLRTNRLLCSDLQKDSFVTALGALFHVQTRRCTLVRAGHLPLFHYRAAGKVIDRVIPRGLGLGLDDAGIFARELEEHVEEYSDGDVLIFATDGVTEARNRAGEEYGEDRLGAVAAAGAAGSAQEIRDSIVRDLESFSAGTEQHDDQTLVVVRVR